MIVGWMMVALIDNLLKSVKEGILLLAIVEWDTNAPTKNNWKI